jgi:peptidoglycan/xylan/chitin deacetylase (PgdA/CDA1 family)
MISFALLLGAAMMIIVAQENFNEGHQKVATVRMDDIQDFWMADTQIRIMEIHLEYRVPISIAIIAGKFGADPKVVAVVKKLLDEKLGEVLNHSWGTEGMSGVPYERQEELMRAANHKLSHILGVEPEIFIPPKWSHDEATITACKELDMRCITRYEFSVLVPEWDNKAQSWKKFNADNAIRRIEDAYNAYGKVDVYIHFQGIHDLRGYEKMIKYLSENYRVIMLSEFDREIAQGN